MAADRPNWKYLVQEAVLILGLSYALWLGGTFNGLIFYSFRLVSVIGLAVMGMVWLVWRWRSHAAGGEKLRFALLALLLAYGLATAGSSDPRRSLIILWQIGLAVWLFWLVCDLLAAGWPAELWAKALVVSGAAVILPGVITIGRWYGDWLAIGGLAEPIPPVIMRIWTLPGHPNYVAGALNLLWPLALARLLGRRGWLMRLVLGSWVAGAWLVLFFTSSRGGWLGAAAALVVLALLWIADRGGLDWLRAGWGWLRQRRLMLGLGVAVAVVVAAGVGAVAWQQLNHPSHGPLMQSRQEYWPPAWEAFLRDPLLGIGPFTFSGEFNRVNSVPPKEIFTHAHGLPLNVLAEAGLIGLLALLGVVGAAGWGLLGAWRAAKPGERVEIMGAAAALVTAAVHGFFDTPQMMPTLAILLVIVGAIGMHGRSAKKEGRRWAGVAPVLWASLVAAAAWSLWGYAPAAGGVSAGNWGNWKAAVPLLETAVERDPSLGINQFHAGYAHGVLAAGDPTHLEPAIAYYRAGLAHDPSYAPHHANLAALLWAGGRRVEAVAEMELAQQWAPRAALFPLNLGAYHEAMGDEAAAAAAYARALDLGGRQASVFWRATPLRAAVLDDWLESRPAGTGGAWSALRQSDLVQARQLFEDTLAGSPNSVSAYRGLAAVALGEGDRAEAGRYLQTALFIGATYSPDEHRRAQMDWARLAAGQGELDEAIGRAAPILEAFRRHSFWGPGRSGTADYGWYVYYRESFLSEMLPQVITAGLPDEVGDWMLETAGWHREMGNVEAARSLCREVLEAIPDHAPAGECLDSLPD